MDENEILDEEQTSGQDEELEEDDLIDTFALSLIAMGIEVYAVPEGEEYPVNAPSIAARLPEEDGGVLDFAFIMLPLKELFGDSIEVGQLYFEITGGVPEERYSELERICNYCNCYTSVGNFIVQRNLGIISCKHCVTLRPEFDDEANVYALLDAFITVRTMANAFRPAILAAVQDGLTLEETMEQNLIPVKRS